MSGRAIIIISLGISTKTNNDCAANTASLVLMKTNNLPCLSYVFAGITAVAGTLCCGHVRLKLSHTANT